jgi:5-methylcytosine-specific restriction endonuclease McrA
MSTETLEQRIEYIDLYHKCSRELSELGYCFRNGIYEIITGNRYSYPTSPNQMKRLIKRYHGKCAICGFNIVSFLISHHIIPRHLGGNNNDSNLLPICPVCHKLMHMIENNTVKNNDVDRYIKRNKLSIKLHQYTEHLKTDYFTNYTEKELPSYKDPSCVDYWL